MISLGTRIVRGSLLVIGVVAAQNARVTVTSPNSEDSIAVGEDFVVEFETEGDVSGPYHVDLFKGTLQVDRFCEPEGCEADNQTVTITISSDTQAASNYTIQVMDAGDSAAVGSSELFEIMSTRDSADSDGSDVTGTGTVGHMNTLMFVVAIVCGIAVCIAIVVGIYVRWYRPSQKSKTVISGNESRGDIETGGGDRPPSSSARMSPAGDQLISTSTSRRGMEKIGRSRSSSSAHPFSSETSVYLSSSENRGRSRTPTRVREDGGDPGPRMMSRTPTRSWQGQEDDGLRMYPTTPQDMSETNSGLRMHTPQHDGLDVPGSRGVSAPRMFSSSPGLSTRSGPDDLSVSTFSSTPGVMWQEPGRSRRMYSGTSIRPGQYEERARIISRSLSAGRERRLRNFDREDRFGDDSIPPIPRPYRRQRSRSPCTVYPRSRSVERYSKTSSSSLEPWQRDVERRREALGLRARSPERWIDGEPSYLRRSQPAHVVTVKRTGEDDALSGAPTYEEYRRTLDEDSNRRGNGIETRVPLGSPSRNRGYRSGLADFAAEDSARYHEVSWEEDRYRHVQQMTAKAKRDNGRSSQMGNDPYDSHGRTETPSSEADSRALTKIYPTSGLAPPALSDASSVGTVSVHSSGSNLHAVQPSYRIPPQSSDTSAGASVPRDILGGEGGALLGSGGLSADPESRVNIHRSLSSGPTGARALSARAAAREAQLSAERALAAAAAASRAANAAAKAATEAEAEADAELGAIIVQEGNCAPVFSGVVSPVGQSPTHSLAWSSTTASTKAVKGGGKATKLGRSTPGRSRPSSVRLPRLALESTAETEGSDGDDIDRQRRHVKPKMVEIEVKVKAKPEVSLEPSDALLASASTREGEDVGAAEALGEFAVANGGRDRSGSQSSEVRGGDTAGGAIDEQTPTRASKPSTMLAETNGGGSDLNFPWRRNSFDTASERATNEHLSLYPAPATSTAAWISSSVQRGTQEEPNLSTNQPQKTGTIGDSTIVDSSLEPTTPPAIVPTS